MKEVKKVTKTYTLKMFGGASFEMKWCGRTIKVEFIPGRGNLGNKKSVLTVSDRFVQDAIEHDARFGKIIMLEGVYGDEEQPKTVAKQSMCNAETKRPMYTRRQLEAMKAAKEKASADAETVADSASANALETEAEDATAKEGKKKEKKKASGKVSEKAADGTSGDALETGTTAEKVESVRTLNDACDYFADKGVVVESEGDLADAMLKAGVVFPNLKK